jgi:hypothetical protein
MVLFIAAAVRTLNPTEQGVEEGTWNQQRKEERDGGRN